MTNERTNGFFRRDLSGVLELFVKCTGINQCKHLCKYLTLTKQILKEWQMVGIDSIQSVIFWDFYRNLEKNKKNLCH